jgi:hypothetical protein
MKIIRLDWLLLVPFAGSNDEQSLKNQSTLHYTIHKSMHRHSFLILIFIFSFYIFVFFSESISIPVFSASSAAPGPVNVHSEQPIVVW